MNLKKQVRVAIVATMFISLVGCNTKPKSTPTPENKNQVIYSGQHNYKNSFNNSDEMKFTQADYDFLVSLKSDNYQELSVKEFNQRLLNWDDEKAYHEHEESLQRLNWSLPQEDENYAFFDSTIVSSWNESEKKHYNTCDRQQYPWHSGSFAISTVGDVFGDPVTLTQADVSYDFDYSIIDESALTIQRRDELLQSIGTQLKTFLSGFSTEQLSNEKEMEKRLDEELLRLLPTLKEGIKWEEHYSIDYWWSQSWDTEQSTENVTIQNDKNTDQMTDQQLQLVLNTLQFPNYESMSIAEFNRKVYALINGYDEKNEDFQFAYEMVRCYLPENHKNYPFINLTIESSLEEYNAREKQVYSGKTIDPEVYLYMYLSIVKDVYGDKVEVGELSLDFNYTYRILKENELTVLERDQFLNQVESTIQKSLEAKKEGELSESEIKQLIIEAGKSCSTDKISFIDVKISYYDNYD